MVVRDGGIGGMVSMKISPKKLLIIFLVCLVVFMAAFFGAQWYRNRERPQNIPEQQVVTITYSSSGFLPQHLRILPGTKVVWINDHPTATMRIADNTTSESTKLVEFGQTDAVAKNGSYDYTFNQVGTYTYRNDVQALEGGTIEVVSE